MVCSLFSNFDRGNIFQEKENNAAKVELAAWLIQHIRKTSFQAQRPSCFLSGALAPSSPVSLPAQDVFAGSVLTPPGALRLRR